MADTNEPSSLTRSGPVVDTLRSDHRLGHVNGLPPCSNDQSGVDVSEAWDRFEVARRAARFYMEKYLTYLQEASRQPEGTIVTTSDATLTTREEQHLGDSSSYWAAKASRDCLIRELSDMNICLQQLAQSQRADVAAAPFGVACFSGITMTVLVMVWPGSLHAIWGKGAAALTLVSSLAYMLLGRPTGRFGYWYHQQAVARCLEAAENWTLTDAHRRIVKEWPYRVLRRFT